MGKDSFVFYKSFYESIKELDPENQLEVFKSIFEYAFYNKNIELNGISKAIFTLMKPNIDNSIARYNACVENGRKGGAPKGNQNAQKQPKNNLKTTQKQPKNKQKTSEKQPKNNLNDNDNVNVNDNDNVNINIHFAEFVSMTNAEYEKLVSTYGKEIADQCISVLDNYKGSSGKTYKSDYRAILNWVVDKVKDKKQTKDFNYKQVSDEDLNWLYEN